MAKAQESYNGDLNDRQTIVEKVFLPIAKEAGFDFTAEELKAAEREQMEEKGISEEELENVSGGFGMCLFVGFSTNVSAAGMTDGEDIMGHACAYVSVGLDVWF